MHNFLLWIFPALWTHKSTFWIQYIETYLCLAIFDDGWFNMMPVILYNTVHELISMVNKLELHKVLKNRYGRDIHARDLF